LIICQGCVFYPYGKTKSFATIRQEGIDSSFLLCIGTVKPSIRNEGQLITQGPSIRNDGHLITQDGSLITRNEFIVKGYSIRDIGDKNSRCLSDAIFNMHRKIIFNSYSNSAWDSIFARLLTEKINLVSHEFNVAPKVLINDTVHWGLIMRIEPVLIISSSYGHGPGIFESIYIQSLLFDFHDRKIVGYCSIKASYFDYKVKELRCDKIIKHVFKKLFIKSNEKQNKLEKIARKPWLSIRCGFPYHIET
jgi:hypothetical protein